jgi:hypothetical protein
MINCRTLGIPFSPQLHLPSLDQPMALLKVNFSNSKIKNIVQNLIFAERSKANWSTKTVVSKSIRHAGASFKEDKHRQFVTTCGLVS